MSPAPKPPFRIEPYRPQDLPALVCFMDALQEHERALVPELKPGPEIARSRSDYINRRVAERNGVALLAKADADSIGFASAWLDRDADPLLKEEEQGRGLVSDIYVVPEWRRRGVASALLARLEEEMRAQGCRRMAICAKAANVMAVECYEAAGYRAYEIILWKPIL